MKLLELERQVLEYQRTKREDLFKAIYKFTYRCCLNVLIYKRKVPYFDAEDILQDYFAKDFSKTLHGSTPRFLRQFAR